MDHEFERQALSAAGHAMRQHEEELWDELRDVLMSVVPLEATTPQAELAMAHALLCNLEAKRLFARVVTLGLASTGFLRDRLEEDGPVGILQPMLRGDPTIRRGPDSDAPLR